MKKCLLFAVVCTAMMTMSAHAVALTTETDYFHCQSAQSTPVGNVNMLADGNTPTWSGTAPASPVPGCLFASVGASAGANYHNIYDMVASGSFLGNLDSLTIRFYMIPVSARIQGGAVTVQLRLGIDGKSMFGTTTGTTTGTEAPNAGSVKTTNSIATDVPGVYGYELTVTGLNFVDDESAEHTVEISVHTTETASIYPMDWASAPGSITFNPETPSTAKLKAKTPGPA